MILLDYCIDDPVDTDDKMKLPNDHYSFRRHRVDIPLVRIDEQRYREDMDQEIDEDQDIDVLEDKLCSMSNHFWLYSSLLHSLYIQFEQNY